MLDVKIENATIIDGSGAPAYPGAIGIRGGRIVELGAVTERAHRTLDAGGQVASPGIIDIHTHYDAQVFWDPTLSPSCFHGVTTVFAGMCGFSIAPLDPAAADYLLPMLARVEGMPRQSLEQGVPWDWRSFGDYLGRVSGRVGLNIGFMAGHSAIRRVVMGERAVGDKASADEIGRMKDLLDTCLREGAMGFSSTVSPTHNDADGNPVPSRHASREELLELAAVCSGHPGTALELLPGLDFDAATLELLTDFSLAGERPVNWNLLTVTGTAPEDLARIDRQLSASDHARTRGAEVIALALPHVITIRINFESGFVLDSIPGWAELFRMPPDERVRKLQDTSYRRRLEQQAAGYRSSVSPSRAATMRIVETFSEANRPFQGRTVGEVAAQLGKASFDTMLDLAIADDLRTSFMPAPMGADRAAYELRARLWRDERTLVGGSDAGAHLDMIDSFAYSTQLLQIGVREHQLISLEEAIRQLTSRPGALMGLRDRGLLRPGYHGDIMVFDPDSVACGEVYTRRDLPAEGGRLYMDAIGISHVMVNGEFIVEEGRHTGQLPGRVLRSGRDTETVPIRH